MDTRDGELNRVLGGGIVPGSMILLGGEPGIGKSTLLLQISLKLPYKTLYVSGEESQKQIKMRAERITPNGDNCYILTETKTQNIFKQIQEIEPDVVIIDSIQTLHTDYIESIAGKHFTNQGMYRRADQIRQGNQRSRHPYRAYYKRRQHRRTENSRAYG